MTDFKNTIKKYWNMFVSVGFYVPERKLVNRDKDAKLFSIQLRADFAHAIYNQTLSYVFGVYVTGIFATFTLYYEKLISKEDTIGFLILLIIIGYIAIFDSNKKYRDKINKIHEEIDTLADSDDPSIGDDM